MQFSMGIQRKESLMALKMIDYEKDQRGMMVMAYGPPGVGKSTLAARIAGLSGGTGVVLDFEVGMQEALREVGKDTKLFDLSEPNPNMGSDVLEFLRKLRNKDEVSWVVIDTLSELAWSLLQGISGASQSTLKMYGERKKLLKMIMHELKNLTKTGKNVLVLSHEAVGEVEGLPGYYAPECPKNDRVDIVGTFDVVGRMQVLSKTQAAALDLDAGTQALNLTRDSQFVSKCRYRIFEPGEIQVVSVASEDDVLAFIKKLDNR
jgi:hypothetical protein